MTQPPRQLEKIDLTIYKSDPVGFIEKYLKETLTGDQKAIALSVRDRKETNVQASHSCGKSFIASRLTVWWVYCVQGLAITTAPTRRQVNQILWSEIRKLLLNHNFAGDYGQTYLTVTESQRAFGFTASDWNLNAFQGLHAERLLLIEDEANGISEEIDDGAISCVTGIHNRILRIGNPVSSGTPFEKSCAKSHIRIPVWQHPNVSWAYRQETDGIHRLKPHISDLITGSNGEITNQDQWVDTLPRDRIGGAISIAWIEDIRKKKGESSAFWQGRVEGLFPTDAESSILPRTWFLAARARYDANPAYWDNHASPHQWRHALDVGDGGDDHALASWKGPVLYSVKAIPTKGDRMDVTRAAGIASKLLLDRPGIMSVDRIGVGAGALSILKEQELNAIGTEWGSAASDNVQFLNAKAEQHWLLREALQNEEVAIAPLGEYEEYAMEDLALTYYEYTSAGKVRIEDKAKTRKRLHRSPNCGDAICMAFNVKQGIDWGEAIVMGSKRIGSTLDW